MFWYSCTLSKEKKWGPVESSQNSPLFIIHIHCITTPFKGDTPGNKIEVFHNSESILATNVFQSICIGWNSFQFLI